MLKPPQEHEILPGSEALLESSDYADDFGQVVSIEDGFLDIDDPAPDSDSSWRRVVLMPVQNGLAEKQEFLDKVRGFRFRARCDFMPPQLEDGKTYEDIGLNLKAFLEGQHQKVYEVLHGETLTISKAEQLYKIKRIRPAGKMFRDKDKGFRFMTAEFLTVLGPTN